MFVRLIIAMGIVAVVWFAMAHYRKQNAQTRKKLTLQYVVIGACLVIVVLGLTGRLNVLSAAVAAIAASAVRLLPIVVSLFPVFFLEYTRLPSTVTSKTPPLEG